MNEQIAVVYTKALFDASLDADSLDQSVEELRFFKKTLDENPKLKVIFENPNIEKAEKKEIIVAILKGASQNVINFLKILIDNQRFVNFDGIYHEYIKKFNDRNNISTGKVYSQRPLDEAAIKRIEETLSKKFARKVELENVIDESLIGGFTIQLDGKFIDNSIKGRLEDLKSSLKERRGEL